jgi:hypothetical protein
VVAQRIPTAVNLGFLDRSRYFFIQVAPQLSSRYTVLKKFVLLIQFILSSYLNIYVFVCSLSLSDAQSHTHFLNLSSDNLDST